MKTLDERIKQGKEAIAKGKAEGKDTTEWGKYLAELERKKVIQDEAAKAIVSKEKVETVDVTEDVTVTENVTPNSITASTPKLEVVYKRTDPEVAPYLHLFPEDVETFSFHVPNSPPLGAKDFRKVIAQKGIDNTRWEDVYFVPEGYVWPSGTKPEMIGASHYNPTNWDSRDKEIWALYQEGKNQKEIAKSLGWKCEVIYKRLRKMIEDSANAL